MAAASMERYNFTNDKINEILNESGDDFASSGNTSAFFIRWPS